MRRQSANGLARTGSLVCSLVWLLSGGGCDDGEGEGAQRDPQPVPVFVTAIPVRVQSLQPVSRLAGVVRPGKRATLSTRASGEVETVHVEAGDEVAAGQVLIEVEARDVAAAAAAARRQRQAAAAALEQARKDAARLQRLYDDDLIARNRLEQARLLESQRKGELARAEAELRVQRVNLDYARVKAPFAGTVSDVLVDAGSFVGPGAPLLVLEDRSRLEVDASIGPRVARRLKPGEVLMVALTDESAQARARLRSVIPALQENAAGSRIRLVVDDPPPGFLPGQAVSVLLPTGDGERTVYRVPTEALFSRGQLEGVFVVERLAEGAAEPPADPADRSAGERVRVRLRWVVVDEEGSSSAAGAAVLQGLGPEDRVVVGDVVERLSDGEWVRVQAVVTGSDG